MTEYNGIAITAPGPEAGITQRAITWLESRGISEQTAIRSGVFTQGVGKETAIAFPTLEGDKVVNIKFRGEQKKFWQEVKGEKSGDLLVIGWGGTYGALFTAVKDLQEEGYSISLAQFNYIMPLPRNTKDLLHNYKKRIVCELNRGQFATYLRSKLPQFDYLQYNKVQGLPFMVAELKAHFNSLLNE